MRVNINPGSRAIAIDGVGVQIAPDAEFPETDPAIEVIMWDGSHLHGMEQTRRGIEPFNDPARMAPYITAWQEEVARRLEKQLQSFQELKTANEAEHQRELDAHQTSTQVGESWI